MWKTLTRYGIVSDRLYEVVMVGWSLDLSDLASNRRRWPGLSGFCHLKALFRLCYLIGGL